MKLPVWPLFVGTTVLCLLLPDEASADARRRRIRRTFDRTHTDHYDNNQSPATTQNDEVTAIPDEWEDEPSELAAGSGPQSSANTIVIDRRSADAPPFRPASPMTVKTSGGRTQIVHEAFEAWLFVSVILGALGVVAVIVFVVREVAPGRDPQLPSSK